MKKPENKFSDVLIRLEKERERLIIEILKEKWQKDPMNFLSFQEWQLR